MQILESQRRRARTAACALLIVSAAVACAGAAGSAGASDGATTAGTSPAPARRDRTLITVTDLREVTASNLYEVVQRLHPDWLVRRNSTTAGTATGRAATMDSDVQVFIGNQHAGNTDILKQLAINGIESLKYYSASEAQGRFGSGNLNGAIQVVMSAK